MAWNILHRRSCTFPVTNIMLTRCTVSTTVYLRTIDLLRTPEQLPDYIWSKWVPYHYWNPLRYCNESNGVHLPFTITLPCSPLAFINKITIIRVYPLSIKDEWLWSSSGTLPRKEYSTTLPSSFPKILPSTSRQSQCRYYSRLKCSKGSLRFNDGSMRQKNVRASG